jgi:hypothetical protein
MLGAKVCSHAILSLTFLKKKKKDRPLTFPFPPKGIRLVLDSDPTHDVTMHPMAPF